MRTAWVGIASDPNVHGQGYKQFTFLGVYYGYLPAFKSVLDRFAFQLLSYTHSLTESTVLCKVFEGVSRIVRKFCYI